MNITDARGKKVVNPPLVLSKKIFLPPLHIKLGTKAALSDVDLCFSLVLLRTASAVEEETK